MHLEAFLADQYETAAIVYELTADKAADFAPNYYEFPDALTKLVNAIARLELALKRFNKSQVEGLTERINLGNLDLLKFDQFDDLGIFIDFVWDQDLEQLQGIFGRLMPEALEGGALMSQQELGVPIDYSVADQPATQFLDRYIPKLVSGVTDVTRDRIRSAVKRSILAGHSRDELVKDLEGIIDNPVRRAMIAQTESIRAFAEGRIQAGIEMGATEKVWRAQYVRCPICDSLDGKRASLIGNFVSPLNGEEYYGAPAHVNCRCGVVLSFGKEADSANIGDMRRDYISSLKSRY